MRVLRLTKMNYYKIIHYTIGIDTAVPVSDVWTKFKQSADDVSADFSAPFAPFGDADPEPLFSVSYAGYDTYIHQVRHMSPRFSACHMMEADGCVMGVSEDWRDGQVICGGTVAGREAILCQIFYSHMVKRRALQIHSSLIRWEGKGLLFLGPSGIGKTTQAELWSRFLGADILNGDMSYVQEASRGFVGWGTPWHGSSPYCMNASVPIYGVVVLKQAEENRIRALDGFERLTAVSKNIFYPLWMEGGMDFCLPTMDRFLAQVPVYELACRPDEEAALLTKETVFG